MSKRDATNGNAGVDEREVEAVGPEPAEAPAEGDAAGERLPVYVARHGRGRLGGTGTLLLLGQRARAQGRAVRFLDGDLKSGSLHAFYGAGCSRPPSDDLVAFRAWALADLDTMAEDGTSRLLDVSGGSDVMSETLQELEIPAFCEGVGARFTWLAVLGPDPEDFQHVRAAADAGHLLPHHLLLVLNEGAIRRGQNPAGAFSPVVSHPDYAALLEAGARAILLPRLPIMDDLRANRLDFYDVAAGKPDAAGNKPKATWRFMAERWTQDAEREIAENRVQSWMP